VLRRLLISLKSDTLPVRDLPLDEQAVEKRYERRQDKAKSDEKAPFICIK
jgi:hypothetical protein